MDEEHQNNESCGAAGQTFSGRVEPGAAGTRLDKFLADALGGELSRARVRQAVEAGLARVGGAVETSAKRRLKPGELVELAMAELLAASAAPEVEDGPVAVVYEDERMVLVNKPAGLTTHPAPSCPDSTLAQRLMGRYARIRELAKADPWRPGIVHRLDKDTSGLMAVALDEPARLFLARQFAREGGEVEKVYLALVHGGPERDTGEIHLPIGRHQTIKTRMAVVEPSQGGREAHSDYSVVQRGAGWSLVRVRIHTGRTHQIRVHLAALGCPILGDNVYGSRQHAELTRERPRLGHLLSRQLLHAHMLDIEHPGGGRVACRVAPPKDFVRAVLHLERRVQRVGVTGMPGSGKSTLLRQLGDMGVPVISADAVVAELYRPGGDGAAMILGRFGGAYMADNGSVDKKALFTAMVASDATRREVESLVHPLVRERINRFFQQHNWARLAVAEVPLLVEAGWTKDFDAVVGVAATGYNRQEWLHGRRNVPPETAALLDGWHWPEEAKLQRCDEVVRNPGTPDSLAQETATLLDALRRRRVARVSGLADMLASHWQDGPCGRTP